MKVQNILKLMSILLEKSENKDIKLKYIHTNEQLMNFLTKAISRGKLSYALSKLGIVDIYALASESVNSYSEDLFIIIEIFWIGL